MLLDLSRHTVRRNVAPYVGSFVALFLGVTLIGLTVEMITAVAEATSRLEPGDAKTRLQLDDLASMFGVMSGFSGFIAIFVVASTFSFVVSSRRRELGLLRLIGSTPRQVRRMILGESLIVAAAASLAGCAFAHLITPMTLWLAHERGLTPMKLDPPTFWPTLAIAFPIGAVVALVGVRSAARRASRIPPVDAMREAAVERRRMGFWRFVVGLVCLAGSLTMLVTMGAVTGELSLVLGIFAPEMLVISAVCFGPWLFPALARLIAWPLVRRGDVTIRLARDNVAASAKRTASLAAPTLAISAIGGSLLLTLGIAADWDHAINQEYLKAPVVVQGDERTGEALASSPAVKVADAGAATSITLIDREGERELEDAQTINVPDAVAARGLTAHKGSLSELHGRTIAMSTSYAFDSGYHLGSTMRVAFGSGKPIDLKVVAIVESAPSLYGDLLLPPGLVKAKPDRWFVVPQSGVADPVSTINAELRGTSGHAESADAWLAATDADLRRNNTFALWVLLGPSGFYAALAIANTLLMGSLQRHREFVATRLIGATERQVRKVVLWESALVTATSLTMGAIISATVAVLVGRSLGSGLESMPVDVPWLGLGAIGATCLVIATVAAVAPTSFMLRRVHPSQAAE
ncbi:ABC transporter permease [Aeromicrobium ginsengisoli]|uniref:ABC transporter permease n=2 Tax=Aeromicrobium ginsengisoli TaxID=363867 RepID=A0A5M4FAI1_9ACTN|nr:ABC transporter permease [Aeromicrobium ginsengisoli]